MSVLYRNLQKYGARCEDFVALDTEGDRRQIRYVDLLSRAERSPMVEAVIESQSQPLLYIISASRLSGEDECLSNKVAKLRRKLAMRAEPAWLGLLWPGKLDIYSTDLKAEVNTKGVSFDLDDPESLSVIPRLASGQNLAEPAELKLRDVLLGLMTHAGMELTSLGLNIDESIALTGRALFFRFLMGRQLINESHLHCITAHAETLNRCFSNEKALADTNKWLDKTFNGDLLQLPSKDYEDYFKQIIEKNGKAVCRSLSAILGLDQPLAPGASQQRLELGWEDLSFDHIPVGILSETYEELMHQLAPDVRRETSVYYTPNNIAEYMVSEALHNNKQGSRARVLDPACGAGVFLTAAYRKLVEMRFGETGIRPQRGELRDILNTQLTGFDINSHARMLAALALYLTALELDPHPSPLEDLLFTKLEGAVLIDVADPSHNSDDSSPMLGSIGEHVSSEYDRAFDLVIGNPPWTALQGANRSFNQVYTKRSREVALRRGFRDIAEHYENPDNVPDLPFIWRAMEWAKIDGRICFALAGRLLFKRAGKGLYARQALFRALSVTGVLNGAALRQTQVWPNMSQHFCLLFADNRVPDLDDQFVFVSPAMEPDLNRKGRMRVDPTDAEPVSLRQVIELPVLFKTLFRGSFRDVEFLNYLTRSTECVTLGKYWTRERGLLVGQGYQVANRKHDDSFLVGLPNVTGRYNGHPFLADKNILPRYESQGLWSPRKPEIYKGPLVLLREGTTTTRNRGRALFCAEDIAYSESFYGFSASEHPDAEFVTKYLFVLFHSALFEYYQLMTSPKYGIEREAILVADAKEFPFISPESLSKKQRWEFEQLSDSLANSQPEWENLDQVVFNTYKVGSFERVMIKDALCTRSPFTSSIERGLAPTSTSEREEFCYILQDRINSVLGRVKVGVHVELVTDQTRLPWRFFVINRKGSSLDVERVIPSEWIRWADDLSLSRITISVDEGESVIVGILDCYRYWTATQARVLATDFIWQFGAKFEGKTNA